MDKQEARKSWRKLQKEFRDKYGKDWEEKFIKAIFSLLFLEEGQDE